MGVRSIRQAHLLNLIYPQDDIPTNTINSDVLVPYELGWKWQGNIADQLINAQSAQVIIFIFYNYTFKEDNISLRFSPICVKFRIGVLWAQF